MKGFRPLRPRPPAGLVSDESERPGTFLAHRVDHHSRRPGGGRPTGPDLAAVPKSVPTAVNTSVATASPGSLIGEIDRELGAMRVTRYQHSTRVDEASGSFMYDCSGLVDYALGRALPTLYTSDG
jgi:hypothetical protein